MLLQSVAGYLSGSEAQLAGAERVVAVESLHPLGLVDGVDVALPEVWGDGNRDEARPVVPGQPVQRAADHRAGGAAEQEPVPGQAMARPYGVRLLDVDHLI